MRNSRAERQLAGAANVFAALGDPTRLALVHRLSDDGPASITALSDRFSAMTRQGVTKHLEVLAAAGVVDASRRGRERIWALNPATIDESRRQLEMVARGWDDVLARLKAHLEGE